MNRTRWPLAGLVVLMLLGVALGGDSSSTRALEPDVALSFASEFSIDRPIIVSGWLS